MIYMQMYQENDFAVNAIESNKNFVLILKKLINIPENDLAGFRKLQETINQTKLLAERHWLLEKVQEKLS